MVCKQASKLIETAQLYLGYLEKATNEQLSSFTANAGSGNWTLFGQWYGGNKNGFAWCAMFVSYCADKAGIPTVIIPKHHSCADGVDWFKKAKEWYLRAGSKPEAGDIIYFSANGKDPAHVGIVTGVDATRVYTIEGNTSGGSTLIANGGGVAKKSYPLTYNKILGYGHPAYVADAPNIIIPTSMLKFGDKGGEVTALQNRLNVLKYSCGIADGDFGPRTREAVKAFQAAKGLTADGIVGAKTWKALMV